MNYREKLRNLIIERAFKLTDRPTFRLSSGKLSRYYFNLKKVNYSPEGQYLVGRIVYEKIKELGLTPKGIGGLTLGADPIATAVSRYSYDMNDPIEAFVIRKEPKGHGTRSQIEGNISSGDEVIIIDDVVTTGGSTIKAIEVAEREGLKILSVIAIVDRCEENGRENILKKGYPFFSVFTVDEFLENK